MKHNKSQILEANFSAQGPRISSSIRKRWMIDCVWGNGEIALTDDLWIIVFLMLSSLCYLVPIELSAVLLPLFVNMQLKVCVFDNFFSSRVSCYQFSVHLFRCVGLVLFFIKTLILVTTLNCFVKYLAPPPSIFFFSSLF